MGLSNDEYNAMLLAEKSNIFGNLFKRAVSYGGYNIRKFTKQLMTNKIYENLLMLDERFEWADECVLLDYLDRKKSFKSCKGVVEEFDEFELWFIGHLYKYWMRAYDKTPSYVYCRLPFDDFHNRFSFYHTQGEEYIIQDTEKRHKLKR